MKILKLLKPRGAEEKNSSDEPESQSQETSEFAESKELTEAEQEFLDLINANREANGLADLEIDWDVQNVARLKVQDLVENNYFSHTSETYGDIQNMLTTYGISYTLSGENIARRFELS